MKRQILVGKEIHRTLDEVDHMCFELYAIKYIVHVVLEALDAIDITIVLIAWTWYFPTVVPTYGASDSITRLERQSCQNAFESKCFSCWKIQSNVELILIQFRTTFQA